MHQKELVIYGWKKSCKLFLMCCSSMILFSLTSCANIVSIPNSNLTPNADEGIIFGRMQFSINGTLINTNQSNFFNSSIITHISLFKGDSNINMNLFSPGELAFKSIVVDDGYFAAKLPVGEYYIVEFIYHALFDKELKGTHGFRTYLQRDGITVKNPKIVKFKVLPNKAIYIGDLIHVVNKKMIEKTWNQEVWMTEFDIRQNIEFESSRKNFIVKFPLNHNDDINLFPAKFDRFVAPAK